jgi:hypothetical protein
MKFIRDIINEQKLSSAAEDLFPRELPTGDVNMASATEGRELDTLELQSLDGVSPDDPATDETLSSLTTYDLAQEQMEVTELEPENVDTPFDDFGTTVPVGDPDDPFKNVFVEAATEVIATGTETNASSHTDMEEQQDPIFSTAETMSKTATEPTADPVVIPVEVPKPATGRAANRSGRVKTRLLGFSTPDSTAPNPFGQTGTATSAAVTNFPVGWLVITDGPGRGAAFSLFEGLTQIGRGEDQTVRLNFGDNSISRENHAAIAFDAEQRKFFFGHGGKANLVRLNNRPVLSTEELASESQIRIGETTLRFVALCGDEFTWGVDQQKVAVNDVAG